MCVCVHACTSVQACGGGVSDSGTQDLLKSLTIETLHFTFSVHIIFYVILIFLIFDLYFCVNIDADFFYYYVFFKVQKLRAASTNQNIFIIFFFGFWINKFLLTLVSVCIHASALVVH